jgi:S-DNA-T family DNA segregation ATPase FtsK/SpoIIIE
MAQNVVKKGNSVREKKPDKGNSAHSKSGTDNRFRLIVGLSLIAFGLFMLIAMTSYFFTGQEDQSVITSNFWSDLRASGAEIENWAGLLGAWLAHYTMYKFFGFSTILLAPFFLFIGYRILFRKMLVPPFWYLRKTIWLCVWLSTFIGYILFTFNMEEKGSFMSGAVGYELALFSHEMINLGTWLLLIISGLALLVYNFNLSSVADILLSGKLIGQQAEGRFKNDAFEKADTLSKSLDQEDEEKAFLEQLKKQEPEHITDTKPDLSDEAEKSIADEDDDEILPPRQTKTDEPTFTIEIKDDQADKEIDDVGKLKLTNSDSLIEKYGYYDPRLDLRDYQFPSLELLKHHGNAELEINTAEIESNKERITNTLLNYGIGIASIKATVGPTVTLYEIVPDAGIRISKIRSLEDDIALSLSALGIRIIAPIPGKGTIGIEVPNKNRALVSIRSVLATEKFIKSEFDLPVVLGKTISNEVFIADLAKMPHLLMAGATGQGKSVGINILLASLLYKKHPTQLKFVLVDPKKVELSLFTKIERHYLAALPDTDEAIITDTRKVIYTLNSLCIEMDNRYSLLKEASVRNLKEYNQKFIERRLNPELGHKYMPYIVLVIDELADLMMTAGKEVETPIARLAQLARAIGIHLVVATQRPSVNVITGIIKANFPARLSFKVSSKIDSRTILDTGGADQLVGQGDMLLSNGSDLVRLQCPFVDTEEIERICDFIGNQSGFPFAYPLPEFEGDEGNVESDFDPANLDSRFEEAARIIVATQMGSTSLLQRKMELGYNRAGRIMDQLENAGIVGPSNGSKAREVLIKDEMSLEQKLKDIRRGF